MIVKEKNNKYIFIPQGIKEWFRIDISASLVHSLKEGRSLPPFYLPVRKPVEKLVYECWILPLAPFVWFYYLFIALFWKMWIDMQTLIDMIVVLTNREHSKKKNNT